MLEIRVRKRGGGNGARSVNNEGKYSNGRRLASEKTDEILKMNRWRDAGD